MAEEGEATSTWNPRPANTFRVQEYEDGVAETCSHSSGSASDGLWFRPEAYAGR